MKFKHVFFSVYFLIMSCCHLDAMESILCHSFCPECKFTPLMHETDTCCLCNKHLPGNLKKAWKLLRGSFCGSPYFLLKDIGVSDESDVYTTFLNIINRSVEYKAISDEQQMELISSLVSDNIDKINKGNEKRFGFTFLHEVLCALNQDCEALKNQYHKYCKHLLDQGHQDCKALCKQAREGWLSEGLDVLPQKYFLIVELLLSLGACPNIKSELEYTPLHIAAECGFLELVKLLINRGALVGVKNDEAHTPLDLAVQNLWQEIPVSETMAMQQKESEQMCWQVIWMAPFDGFEGQYNLQQEIMAEYLEYAKSDVDCPDDPPYTQIIRILTRQEEQ